MLCYEHICNLNKLSFVHGGKQATSTLSIAYGMDRGDGSVDLRLGDFTIDTQEGSKDSKGTQNEDNAKGR